MIGYRFLSTALTEASDAALFYEKESGGLGTKFLDAIDITIEKLRKIPKERKAPWTTTSEFLDPAVPI